MSTPLNFFIWWKNKSSWIVDIKQGPHMFTSSTALLFRVTNTTVPLGTRCSFCCVFHRVRVWFQRCLVYPHKSVGCNKTKPYLWEGKKITLSFSGCQTAASHFLGQTRTSPAGSVLQVMLCWHLQLLIYQALLRAEPHSRCCKGCNSSGAGTGSCT